MARGQMEGEPTDRVELDPLIREFYEQGREQDRLFREHHPSGPLEFARTKELIERHIPIVPADVLDVGGGPGAYSAWLNSLGYHVELIDPVPLHVEQASALGIVAELGDARSVNRADSSFDVLLLLGPLYHLVQLDDRMAALAEARRVLRAGGTIFTAAISRYAAFLDFFVRRDQLHDQHILRGAVRCMETGLLGDEENTFFTTAYAHRPQEFRDEIRAAGFVNEVLYSVEGPGFQIANFAERWSDPPRRAAVLEAARLVETNDDLMPTSSHLLICAKAP